MSYFDSVLNKMRTDGEGAPPPDLNSSPQRPLTPGLGDTPSPPFNSNSFDINPNEPLSTKPPFPSQSEGTTNPQRNEFDSRLSELNKSAQENSSTLLEEFFKQESAKMDTSKSQSQFEPQGGSAEPPRDPIRTPPPPKEEAPLDSGRSGRRQSFEDDQL